MTMTSLADRFTNIKAAVSRNSRFWLLISLGFVVLYYAALMIALIVRFGNWPNYATFYNWPANVWTIIQSTPSVSDMLPIIRDEWLFEAGYMNMSFGNGISEWSLNLIPGKIIVILALGMLIATSWALFHERLRGCSRKSLSSLAATGSGSALVALTAATMSWVVCCATPSWIVGLAMLGMGVATANWLEPAGLWLAIAGFVLLAAGVLAQAGLPLRSPAPRESRQGKASPAGTSASRPASGRALAN